MSSVRSLNPVEKPTKFTSKSNTSLSVSQKDRQPSPAPSNTSIGKRKRMDTADHVPFSQPATTGTGHERMTQVIYAIDHVKEKDRPLSFDEILGYLSLQHSSEQDIKALHYILKIQSRLEYNRKGLNGIGSFTYRPIHNVRSEDDLKGFLQKRTTAQGVSVKELKDGWKGADKAIAALERKGEVLVTHLKKDNAPKMVWHNDPTLIHKVDENFHKLWHSIKLPSNPEELRSKLEAAGLKPASAPKPIVVAKPKEKKKKAVRRGGRQTNTHMVGILRDYSHKRK
jgi:transcription initiation factor TFIIE subunit beta